MQDLEADKVSPNQSEQIPIRMKAVANLRARRITVLTHVAETAAKALIETGLINGADEVMLWSCDLKKLEDIDASFVQIQD